MGILISSLWLYLSSLLLRTSLGLLSSTHELCLPILGLLLFLLSGFYSPVFVVLLLSILGFLLSSLGPLLPGSGPLLLSLVLLCCFHPVPKVQFQHSFFYPSCGSFCPDWSLFCLALGLFCSAWGFFVQPGASVVHLGTTNVQPGASVFQLRASVVHS